MSDPSCETELRARAQNRCELCGDDQALSVLAVPPQTTSAAERAVLVCDVCRGQVTGEQPLVPRHWHCLQQAAWSEVPAVVVVSWRLLGRLTGEGWAQELRDQMYLDDDVLSWAQAAMDAAPEEAVVHTRDSNGTPLANGDAVTLIKDLDVKGASFTAKRGTVVKNIRLTDDPGLVEGRVNAIAIVLKTEFLKKVG